MKRLISPGRLAFLLILLLAILVVYLSTLYKLQIVEGTKNSSIFLPATGHMEDEFVLDPGVNCGYWSSNIDPDNPAYAWFVYFEEGGVYRTIGPRKYGYSVRPVPE